MDPRVNCGATVVLAVMYTGDTGQMAAPSAISGRTVATRTSSDRSVVSVEIVRRNGSWWVATPEALNPLHATDGGYSESELRQQHRELLAAR